MASEEYLETMNKLLTLVAEYIDDGGEDSLSDFLQWIVPNESKVDVSE